MSRQTRVAGRRDLVVVLALLCLAAALWLARGLAPARPAAEGTVVLRVDGEEKGRYPLSEDRDIALSLPDGSENLVRVEGGSVRMAQANCPGGDCLRQTPVTLENLEGRALGRYIICLPHRVTVELWPEEGAP